MCPAGLAADLRRDAAAAGLNLRDDLAHHKEGQAVWADSLPGAAAFVAAAEGNRSFSLLPAPPTSLHLAATTGSFAAELRAIYDRRLSAGLGEGPGLIFRLHSASMSQAAEPALNALGTSNAEGDALLISRIGRRIGPGRPGDLVASIFGDMARDDSEPALHLRGILHDIARGLYLRGRGAPGGDPCAAQFSLA
jgi:hypothetical protein